MNRASRTGAAAHVDTSASIEAVPTCFWLQLVGVWSKPNMGFKAVAAEIRRKRAHCKSVCQAYILNLTPNLKTPISYPKKIPLHLTLFNLAGRGAQRPPPCATPIFASGPAGDTVIPRHGKASQRTRRLSKVRLSLFLLPSWARC